MKDLINRQDALNISFKVSASATKQTAALIQECFLLYAEYIRGLPSAKGFEWVPVSERLPEEEKPVLVTAKTKNGISVLRGFYGDGYWHGTGGKLTVIAWAEIPDPYQE